MRTFCTQLFLDSHAVQIVCSVIRLFLFRLEIVSELYRVVKEQCRV